MLEESTVEGRQAGAPRVTKTSEKRAACRKGKKIIEHEMIKEVIPKCAEKEDETGMSKFV